MATQNQSHFSGNPGYVDPDYDSEEEFIDDTQFEDPEDFVDDIRDEGNSNFNLSTWTHQQHLNYKLAIFHFFYFDVRQFVVILNIVVHNYRVNYPTHNQLSNLYIAVSMQDRLKSFFFILR